MSTLDDTISVVLVLLQDLDTPRSLTVKLLIEHEEWGQLANLAIDPAHYLTADQYFRDAAATEILRKVKNLPGVSKKQLRHVALEKWLEAEKLCFRTNRQFSNYCSGYYPGVDGRVVEYLHRVKKRIARVLGRLPDDLTHSKHGKGATYHDKGRNCTVLHKMQSRPTMTAGLTDLLPLLEESAWMRAVTRRKFSSPEIVEGNRFTTVPKTIKGDRSIAIEPSLNIYLQLGVGGYIRRRLKRYAGVDLDEGQHTHRALAREGSVSNALATLDLSSASDTVGKELVRFLFPEDWWLLLNSLRSPKTRVGARSYMLEKLSSMGNGFTFEVETLIFWALVSELSEVAYVYGDDIIVTASSAHDCIAALKFCGFVINESKSFTTGRFRESCGGDFFDGFNVRPFYLKELPNEPQQWIAFANGLWHLGRRFSDGHGGLDPRVRSSYLRCLGFIPSDIRRLKGPAELGDVCLSDDDISRWRIRVKNWIRYVECYLPVGTRIQPARFDPEVQLAAALYGTPSEGPLTRSGTKGYKKRWVPCS